MNPMSSRLKLSLFRSTARALGAAVLLGAGPARAAPKIGVLLKGDTAFWHAVEAGAGAAARQAGAEVIVRMPPSESDIATQVRLLNEMAGQGIAGLIIAPGSSAALSGPVAAVAAKGVKIVVIDSPLDVDMPAYIATNHTNAGQAAGQLLASLVGDQDEVSLLRHSRTGGATLLRESSAYAALCASHPHLVVHRDIFTGTDGREVPQARLLLQKYPGTTAVLATGTPGSMAMLQVLDAPGRAAHIKFVGFGFDLNPAVASAIDRGVMDGWIAQLPHDIGARGVNAMLALLQHQPVPEVIYCDFLVITKANLHDPRVQALLPAAAGG
jgi:ribose transport system substrate-binding protein